MRRGSTGGDANGVSGQRLLRLLSGCLAAAAVLPAVAVAASAVTVVGPTVKVRPTAQVAGAPAATLTAARNEFESFQVVVTASGAPGAGLVVALSEPLRSAEGTIPAENVTIYREAYGTFDKVSDSEGATGRWPDALIPAVDPYYREARRAFPVDVPAGENRVAFVDVLVPQSARRGSTPARSTCASTAP
jgi:hypothetical protein